MWDSICTGIMFKSKASKIDTNWYISTMFADHAKYHNQIGLFISTLNFQNINPGGRESERNWKITSECL